MVMLFYYSLSIPLMWIAYKHRAQYIKNPNSYIGVWIMFVVLMSHLISGTLIYLYILHTMRTRTNLLRVVSIAAIIDIIRINAAHNNGILMTASIIATIHIGLTAIDIIHFNGDIMINDKREEINMLNDAEYRFSKLSDSEKTKLVHSVSYNSSTVLIVRDLNGDLKFTHTYTKIAIGRTKYKCKKGILSSTFTKILNSGSRFSDIKFGDVPYEYTEYYDKRSMSDLLKHQEVVMENITGLRKENIQIEHDNNITRTRIRDEKIDLYLKLKEIKLRCNDIHRVSDPEVTKNNKIKAIGYINDHINGFTRFKHYYGIKQQHTTIISELEIKLYVITMCLELLERKQEV